MVMTLIDSLITVLFQFSLRLGGGNLQTANKQK